MGNDQIHWQRVDNISLDIKPRHTLRPHPSLVGSGEHEKGTELSEGGQVKRLNPIQTNLT